MSASYLVTQKITVARVQNATGNFEFPNLSNIENAAAEIKTVPAGNAMHIVDPPKKIVLGLLVDGSRLRLLPEFKQRIEVHVRGVERNGVSEHAEHRHFDSILAMINHVDGCVAFAGSVEADYADRIARRWAEVLAARGYPRPEA